MREPKNHGSRENLERSCRGPEERRREDRLWIVMSKRMGSRERTNDGGFISDDPEADSVPVQIGIPTNPSSLVITL